MRPAVAAFGAAALLLTGCTSTSAPHSASHSASATTPTATSPPAPPVIRDATVWLCHPGRRPDPCASDLTTTVITTAGRRSRQPAPKPRATGLDCFYVYPTVSTERSANADLTIGPRERGVALAQAARFSSVCRVWAPMYRQRTTSDLLNLADDAPQSAANLLALGSLEAAWRDYLAHDNGGRPVVVIGHSQGASMLIRLLRKDVDPAPAVRAKVALALLLGGNVTVADGQLTGGSFQHLPLCSRHGQRGCVIAYSSFPGEPPAFAFFGRAGFGVSMLSGEPSRGRQVACVNPAAIGGGRAALHPYFPTALAHVSTPTPWLAYPGRYVAQCRHAGNATWLQVTPTGTPPDTAMLTQGLGSSWGYHVADVNLALGDLVADVAAVAHAAH